MENSKKIQIGLLAVVAVLLALNFFGAFEGMFGGSSSDSAREEALSKLSPTDAAVTAPATSATPAEPATPAGPTTTMEFTETEFDFGTVDSGEKVNHTYKFTNTGSEPLIISNAKGSCGCTVPSWPKEPIAPGASADIQVQFDSKGKSGKQSKRVTITANTDPAQTFLTIKGEVNKTTPATPEAK